VPVGIRANPSLSVSGVLDPPALNDGEMFSVRGSNQRAIGQAACSPASATSVTLTPSGSRLARQSSERDPAIARATLAPLAPEDAQGNYPERVRREDSIGPRVAGMGRVKSTAQTHSRR